MRVGRDGGEMMKAEFLSLLPNPVLVMTPDLSTSFSKIDGKALNVLFFLEYVDLLKENLDSYYKTALEVKRLFYYH